jgi:DNA-directed RNA polymerase subunit RPC12/RpoP
VWIKIGDSYICETCGQKYLVASPAENETDNGKSIINIG